MAMKASFQRKCSRTTRVSGERQSVRVDALSKFLLPLGACLLLMSCLAAKAQDYSIDWWDTSPGGTSTGGIYTVSGSIGQPDAGTLAGGEFILTGGFWSAVTLGEPPVLGIALTATNTIVLSWASPSPGFVLQECTNLNQAVWPTTQVIPTDDGTTRSVVLPMYLDTRFYRLKK